MQTPQLIQLPTNPQFQTFWEQYPKRKAKFAAKKAFDKAIRQTTIEELLTAIAMHKQSEEWRKGFIPHPATWLNQGRWLDEIKSQKPIGGNF